MTKGSKYASICPNCSWICLFMPEYVRICQNISKSSWMAFVLHISIVIPWLCLKESWAVFCKTQNLIFSKITESIWFLFVCCCDLGLNIFTSKISNLLLPLWTKGQGLQTGYTHYIYDAIFVVVVFIVFFFVVVFFTFWCFKGLNWRLTKSVIL